MRNIALKQVLADSLIDNVRKHSNHVFILECLFGKGNSLANLKRLLNPKMSFHFPPIFTNSTKKCLQSKFCEGGNERLLSRFM